MKYRIMQNKDGQFYIQSKFGWWPFWLTHAHPYYGCVFHYGSIEQAQKVIDESIAYYSVERNTKIIKEVQG